MRKFVLLAGCTLAWCAAAWADTRATEAANLARFQKYAGAPVQNFTFWDLYKWQILGPDKLAVWSGVNDVFLLTVEQPCINLENAKGIVLTSKMSHQVNRKLDFVVFGTQQCQILEIRPVDYKTMLKDGEGSTKH